MINIISNGSKWYGQDNDSVHQLLEVLGNYTLDPVFEDYGNFILNDENSNTIKFFGNFLTLSHVFNIETDEQEIIETLTNAIRKNQQTKEYMQGQGKIIN